MNSAQYCLFYCTKFCFSISEWKDIILSVAATIAVPSAIFTAVKTFSELKKQNEERRKERELKSIEFTLQQHRRLFDDKDLFSVLSLIDNDDQKLANLEIWDAKRKLLVFFEELQLLINSEKINRDVAYYLFG
jgi:hypothetical protein